MFKCGMEKALESYLRKLEQFKSLRKMDREKRNHGRFESESNRRITNSLSLSSRDGALIIEK